MIIRAGSHTSSIRNWPNLQARYAVPDSENAAILYNKILADWKQKEANEPNLPYDKFDFARRNLWLT